METPTISEKEFIRDNCKIECKWEHANERWVVKINHITDEVAYSSVRVVMEGFDNFRDACDEAVKLFKRNLRNNIKDLQTVNVKYKQEDVWPEYIN